MGYQITDFNFKTKLLLSYKGKRKVMPWTFGGLQSLEKNLNC